MHMQGYAERVLSDSEVARTLMHTCSFSAYFSEWNWWLYF